MNSKSNLKNHILYVHPKSQMMFKELIPISVPATINFIARDYKILGLFQKELSTKHIKEAKIIILDIHWYLTLPNAINLSKKIKKINPLISIIVAGLTASYFHKQIIMNSSIDFIIRGDVEVPMKLLIKEIISKTTNYESIPNLTTKNISTVHSYSTNKSDYNNFNYLNIDFFPTFKKKITQIHRINLTRPISTHPAIMTFKGCFYDCNNCVGSNSMQQKIFKRDSILKDPTTVKKEIISCIKMGYKFVNFFHDFITQTDLSYINEILNEKYSLYVYYEFARPPQDLNHLDMLMNSFKGGIISIPVDLYHGSSNTLTNFDLLKKMITKIKKNNTFSEQILFSKYFYINDQNYKLFIEKLFYETNMNIINCDFFWSNFPGDNLLKTKKEEEYNFYLKNKGKKFILFNFITKTWLFINTRSPRFCIPVLENILLILTKQLSNLTFIIYKRLYIFFKLFDNIRHK